MFGCTNGYLYHFCLVPLEYKVLKREYFNGWYDLFPYMMSTLLVEIPFQVCYYEERTKSPWELLAVAVTAFDLDKLIETVIIFQILCCIVYIVPAYVFTNQPLELMRFSYFTIFLVVTSLTSQSTGYLFGATLPVKVNITKKLSIFTHWHFNIVLKCFSYF